MLTADRRPASPSRRARLAWGLAWLLLAGLLGPVRCLAATTTRVSLSSAGAQWSGPLNPLWHTVSVSADGRYLAFDSDASDLVTGDTNLEADVFVKDTATGAVTRVSVGSDGTQANGGSWRPSLRADGRSVAFMSYASNLVAGDTNGDWDIFVHDLTTGVTTRVSVGSTGTQGDGNSWSPALRADGTAVAFESEATDLVADDTNGKSDIFLHDLSTGVTTRVSVGPAGAQANGDSFGAALSGDGRVVAFESFATNLVAADSNGCVDVFARDLAGGTTALASVSSAGVQGNGDSRNAALSADGRYVAFESSGGNLVAGDTDGIIDIFRRDREEGTTVRASVSTAGAEPTEGCLRPSLSADGRYLAFESLAAELTDSDTNAEYDVFVRDLTGSATERASVSTAGARADGKSGAAALSADGRTIGFWSLAANLVSDDTNAVADVFARQRDGATCTLALTGLSGQVRVNGLTTALPASFTVLAGSTVLLEAVPDVHYAFAGWSGGLTGSATPARAAITTDTTIVAEFTPSEYALTVAALNGSGSLDVGGYTVAPAAVPWTRYFSRDTEVTVTALPGAGYHLFSWSGDLSGAASPTSITMDGTKSISAAFAITSYSLSLAGSNGVVLVNGVSHALPWSQSYEYGAVLTLTAVADSCWRFVQWTGAASGATNPLTLTITGAQSLTAEFGSLLVFSDVLCDSWALAPIAACYRAGIVQGYADGYHPTETVTRAQMAVYLARALVGGDAAVPTGPATPTFADVPADDWAYRHIEYLASAACNVVRGYTDGYHPTEVVNRAQMAVFVARSIVDPTGDAGLTGYTPPPTATFADVPTDFWAYPYVEYLADPTRAIVQGYWDGYRPADSVTRDQMAVYLTRAFGLAM